MIKKKLLKKLSRLSFLRSSNVFTNNIYCDSKFQLARYLFIKIKLQKNKNLLRSYKFSEIQLITIDLASPEKIKDWAERKLPNGKIFGQVTNPNTLHYKTLKPLKGGLFCERIFGPIKDFECACGIHKQKPFNRIISFQNKQFCPKCDIEYTWSDIRRYQLGYIELVTPITHLWYLKGMPSYIRSVLGAKKKHIEGIAYCSEIVTIDKAWKPNRFIPFPEIVSSSRINSKIKKPLIADNRNHIINLEIIYKNLRQYNSSNRKIKYFNKKLLQKKFNNKIFDLKCNAISNSIFFFKYFNINLNFVKTKKFDGIRFFDRNPYSSKIDNFSYKNKIYFYQETCRSFIKISLKKNKPIYALNFLYRSFSNSKIYFKTVTDFYNIDNIISLFNKELLMIRFNNLYKYNKYYKDNKYYKIFDSSHSNKIHININKNFLYYKNKKVANLQVFNNFKLLTKISNNIVSKNVLKNDTKKNSLILKIQFLNTKLNFQSHKFFLNNPFLFYFNNFSIDYFKNSHLFVNFAKLLTLNYLKLMKYKFFNIFIIPISTILQSIILKISFDAQFKILLKSISLEKQKFLNSDLVTVQSYKTLKKEFFIKNFSLYDEANEILWHKFWKICHFFTYNKINKKFRKLIKTINTKPRTVESNGFSLLKNVIKKIKMIKKITPNFNNLEVNKDPKNKFALFINFIKIYFKKILFIYEISPEYIDIKKSFFLFQKFFFANKDLKAIKNKVKNIVIKVLSLELIAWILSQFLLTSKHFSNFKKLKFINNSRKNNEIQCNLIQKIQENSFFNFNFQMPSENRKNISNLRDFFNFFNFSNFKTNQLNKKIFIYSNKIKKILKHRKLRLFLTIWFSNFLKKDQISDSFFINLKFNNLNFKNLESLILLFYQKRWLLKKKQIFINYRLRKRSNSPFLISTLSYYQNFIKLISSSICKTQILISILSIQIKKFYKLNLVQNIPIFFNANNFNYFQTNRRLYSKVFKSSSPNLFTKQLNYVYSFILFSSKMNKKFFVSLTNEKYFLNLFCFFKFAKKILLKKFSWLNPMQKYFYSLEILKYQKKQQKKVLLKFVQKKIFFHKILNLIYSFLSYCKKKLKLIRKDSLMQLILKKKFFIFSILKKLEIKLINEIQKYYFYECENKKIHQIKLNINNFKNMVIAINVKTKKLVLDSVLFISTKDFFYKKNILFIKFFSISKFWQIIIKILKNRINNYSLLSKSLALTTCNNQGKLDLSMNNFNKYLRDEFYFNSFLMKLNISNCLKFSYLIINNKKKIIQTREHFYKYIKSNNLFLINYLKKNWDSVRQISTKKNKLFSNLFFFIYNTGYHSISNKKSINLNKNYYSINFYLKFIKQDLNKTFNEAIFSVISESRRNFNFFWNNIYSLSNRYSWKSDIELNIFLCYMLSPENPSDILIPVYKQRIHSSNVLREEPPIAGGGIILKFLKELDLPEMKKIDIQLQTILKKIPNKLHEIEVLLKHYQTNLKFLKYYSLKRRTLIEIEKSILRKLKYIRRLNWVSAKPEYMIIRNLPVLPADLRPIFKIQQQLTASDLNRLYQKVMYRNDRLKRFIKNSTTSNSFEMLFAQRMLQEAVDNLIENGKDINSIETDSRGRPLKSLGELLKGKKGRFRQNLLGKRVDYSGRSVIVVGPKLQLHECGLPIEMAIELFLPFLIKDILKNKYALTVRSAKVYIKKHRIEITQLLRNIVKRQPILLNRAPTLHRLGIQAFLPKLVEGKAILLHPLVCSAFNADFDGDQMAVHVPITNEARIEAWKLVLSRNNLLSPATGEPVLLPSQDMVLGCYYLTIENFQLLLKKQQKINRINYNKTKTVFSNFENIFIAYQLNQIHLHTNIWVKYNHNNIESDSILQKPIEIQLQLRGQYTKIYSDYYQKFNRTGAMYNQVIRTTPGRILFNLMLNNCFN